MGACWKRGEGEGLPGWGLDWGWSLGYRVGLLLRLLGSAPPCVSAAESWKQDGSRFPGAGITPCRRRKELSNSANNSGVVSSSTPDSVSFSAK